MAQYINPETGGKVRAKLCKTIVLAIRQLMKQTAVTDETKDLAAYIVISLQEIQQTIEDSVAAWEKRGYWVKADRYRMEWLWANAYGNQLLDILKKEQWDQFAPLSVMVMQKLDNIKVSDNHRMGSPWVGSWRRLFP